MVFELANHKQELSITAMEILHRISDFREKICIRDRLTRNKNWLSRPCLLTDRTKMNTVYRGPFIYASYQISVHLAKRFQRRLFIRNQPIRNKNCLYRPCLWTNQDEIGNLHGGPSIHASYQVSVHCAKQFHMRRVFRNGPIWEKNGCGDHICYGIETKLTISIENLT